MSDQLHDCLSIFGLPGGAEWIFILAVALLLFGKKLPEVARSLGKGIIEFKKGLREVEDEVERATSSVDYSEPSSHDDSDAASRQNYEEIYGQSGQDSYDESSSESSSPDQSGVDESATDETVTDETARYEGGDYETSTEGTAAEETATEDTTNEESATEPGSEVTAESEND